MGLFHFKSFSVSHHRSAMKVGVDGVLIGCWADVPDPKRILDVGTGCGLIALIMAQRYSGAKITGIDIDAPSVEEAGVNVASSKWSDRVDIIMKSFGKEFGESDVSGEGFDLIVSNPPFFNSGLKDAATPRELARHQSGLSPYSLLLHSKDLLTASGRVAMIIPSDEIEPVEKYASELGYQLERKCRVRGHEGAPWKRCLLQWGKGCEADLKGYSEKCLTLESSPGIPTDDYRSLCKDFYLKF